MIPLGRPKGECRSAEHEGILIRRTSDRGCARVRACKRALRLATRVLQA